MAPSTCLARLRTISASTMGSSSVSAMNSQYPDAHALDCAPLQMEPKNGFSRSGTTSPILPVRPVMRPLAARLGRQPIARAVSWT